MQNKSDIQSLIEIHQNLSESLGDVEGEIKDKVERFYVKLQKSFYPLLYNDKTYDAARFAISRSIGTKLTEDELWDIELPLVNIDYVDIKYVTVTFNGHYSIHIDTKYLNDEVWEEYTQSLILAVEQYVDETCKLNEDSEYMEYIRLKNKFEK